MTRGSLVWVVLAAAAAAVLGGRQLGAQDGFSPGRAATSSAPSTRIAPSPAPAVEIPLYTASSVPRTPALAELKLADRVSQYGITWTFDRKVPVGQFVNGDWYVVGPVQVTAIDPKPLWGQEVDAGELVDKGSIHEAKEYPGRQARNGSSLNPPAAETKAGFDSRIPSGRYDPNLFSHLPISMKPGDALVSTISRPTSELKSFSGQHVDPLEVAAVLSCVGAPQPADAFRPSYCDSRNSRIYLSRNLKRELLLNLPRLPGTPDRLDRYAARFQKPWLDLAQFGFAAPVQNLPHYGQQFAEAVGEGSLLLQMDYQPQEKEPLLVNMTQAGIDFWGLVRAGRSWPAHGGLNSGRKWLILQAGLLLGDTDMQSPNRKYPNCLFHEDNQTAMGPVTYGGKTYATSWSGAKAIFMGHSPYLIGRKGHWEDGWGPVDLFAPSDWPLPGKLTASEGYRRANTSPCWVGQALAARLLHAEKIWGHDAFFAYVDRWMTEDDTRLNQALKDANRADYTTKKPGEFGRHGHVSGAAWVKEAWRKWRDNIPPAADGTKTPPADATWK